MFCRESPSAVQSDHDIRASVGQDRENRTDFGKHKVHGDIASEEISLVHLSGRDNLHPDIHSGL